MDATYTAPPVVGRYRTLALIVGVVGVVLAAVISLLLPPEGISGVTQFFRSYHVGFFFCTGLAVGSIAWMALLHLTGGGWGIVSRRLFEAATRTLPLVFVFFIPFAIGVPYLFEWSHKDNFIRGGQVVDEALYHKSTFLNLPFFIGRAIFYFVVWGLLAYFMNKWSQQQDHTGDPRIRRRLQELSGPAILLFGLTVTFAGIDWGMSLEPHWFSTIYGLIVMAGWGLSAFALMITMAALLSKFEPADHIYLPQHFHDFGKLLLAMVMLYAYFSFSQFLITWSGNLPEEITFYLRRLRGGWQYVGLALILFHFALPFVLLLSRSLKRRGRTLLWVALLMIFMRMVDLVFLFAPAATQEGHEAAGIHPVDFVTMLAATVGLGGIWLWYYLGQVAQRPLVPLGERDLEKALTVAEHH